MVLLTKVRAIQSIENEIYYIFNEI